MGKFAMGQSVPRTEDPRLLTGRGRYIDDVSMIAQCHAFVLRSPHAHACIRAVDIAAANGMPGVGDCQYFNPWGSSLTGTGSVNSPALTGYIQQPFSYVANSELLTVDGVITGEIGELPGGPAGIAIGAQLRDEGLDYDYNDHQRRWDNDS